MSLLAASKGVESAYLQGCWCREAMVIGTVLSSASVQCEYERQDTISYVTEKR